MSTTEFLDKCEEFYETRDFYEVLKVKKDATEKEIKKAYHKLSLTVHPDRVDEKDKLEATEKFKVLSKIHSILQDPEKRKVYDDCGEFDDDASGEFNWYEYWNSMFRRITTSDIENYQKEYMGSEAELRDIRKAYVNSKGNMDYIYEMVQFCNLESEERIKGIVRKLIDDGEVEEYDGFFNEPRKKFLKRKRKLEKEREEVESLKIEDSVLEQQIQKNHEERQKSFLDLLTSIEDRYGGSKKRKRSLEDTSTKRKSTTKSPTKRRASKGKK